MNCRKVNQYLSAYMDGELRGVEHRQIFEHLSRCPECEQEYASLLQMKRMLGSMRTVSPSRELQAKISYAITWEEGMEANRTPDRILMRVQHFFQEFFVSPQGLGLGALALLGLYTVLHHLPLESGSAHSETIVWQKTPNSVSELTAGLAPSAPQRFILPPVRRSNDAMPQEVFQIRQATDRTFEPLQPSQNHYELTNWKP